MLPGLDKAEGREPEPVPPTYEELQAQLSQVRELYDSYRIAATRDFNELKQKFNKLDDQIARYQLAVAALVAEPDEKKRVAIRDSLAQA